MKKHQILTRITAIILTVIMLSGMQLPLFEAFASGNSDDFALSEITPDISMENEEEVYDDDETVRVSIVLEDEPTIAAQYDLNNIAENDDAMSYRDNLEQIQEIVVDNIETYALDGEELDVIWNLTLAANVISANVEYGKMDEIEAMDGVKEVFVETVYYPDVMETTEDSISTNMAGSSSMTGSSLAYSTGYTGAGSRVAIIDTGIDTDHQSFDAGAYEYSLHQLEEKDLINIDDLDLMTEETIAGVLDKLNVADNGITAKELYRSSKLPFAYNYNSKTTKVDHHGEAADNEHGSHVAGIAAANAYIPSDTAEGGYVDAMEAVGVRGIAPDAQILTLRVFNALGGAYESDFMVAIEDAILLGADTINLSLGTGTAGFRRPTLYTDILENLVESGTVCVASAGNSAAWADKGKINGYLFAEDVNMYTAGSPGSYSSSLSVASVDNCNTPENYITVDGTRIYFNIPNADSITGLDGQQTYIYLPGDALANQDALDALGEIVKGNILVCQRGGGIPLSTIANNAAKAGASAVIIVNNEIGTLEPELSAYSYKNPVLTVTKSDGALLKNAAEAVTGTDGTIQYYQGTLTVSENTGSAEKDSCYTMSFFSSFGVPGSLTLTPEISAPGGKILSVNGKTVSGKDYVSLSGTSMAAPQIAGMSAVMGQYIQDAKLTKTDYTSRFLTQNLLMSSAVPMKNTENKYYHPVLQQGSGLANLQRALNAQALIVMGADATDDYADGKVKVELGDDTDRTGSYGYTFTIKNFSGKENQYILSTELFTQGIRKNETLSNGEKANLLDKLTTPLSADVTYIIDNESVNADTPITVDAYGKLTINVKIKLTEKQKKELDASYRNGAYVEGYTFINGVADEEDIKDVDYSIPIVGFYGNWSSASMYDHSSYTGMLYGDNTMSYVFDHSKLQITDTNYLNIMNPDTGESRIYTGNPYGVESKFPEGRGAMRSTDIISGYTTTLIRNPAAAGIFLTKEDDTFIGIGNIRTQIYGAFCYRANWSTISNYISFNRTPASMDLKDGDVFKVKLVAVPEYYETNGDIDAQEMEALIKSGRLGEGAYLSTTLNIDDTKPEIIGIKKEANGNLTVTARDNQYIAYMCISNRSGSKVYASYIPNAEKNGTVTYTFDLQGKNIGPNCMVLVGDYAANTDTRIYNYGAEYPDLKGKLGGYIHDGRNTYNKTWIAIDPNDVHITSNVAYGIESVAQHGGDTVTAAAYVDGYIYQVIGSKLYTSPANEIDNMTELVDLERFRLHSVYALSYNITDHMLYALTSGNNLWGINPRNGYATKVAQITVSNLSGAAASITAMAIDDGGTFYGVSYYNTSSSQFLKWTLDDVNQEKITITGTAFTGTAVRDRFGSMVYHPEEKVLYLAESYENNTYYTTNHLFRIDTQSGKAEYANTSHSTDCRLYYSVRGLFVVPTEDDGDDTLTPTKQIEKLDILPETLDMFVTGYEDLIPIITPWNAENQEIVWSTTNNQVVTVKDGIATAVGTGEATVTVTSVANPSVTDSCIITVKEIPDIQMSALIYENNKKGYLADYNVSAPQKWEKKSDAISYPLYSGGLSNGTIYAHDGSWLYTIDPETLKVEQGAIFSYLDFLWSDATQAPKNTISTFKDVIGITDSGKRLGVYNEKTARYIGTAMNFSSPAATVAYVGEVNDGTGMNYRYYVMLEDGSLYDVVYPLYSSFELLGVVPGIDLTGVSACNRSATASMEYDQDTGYLILTSRIKGNKAKVQLINPKTLRVMSNTDFGEDVWPVVAQYQYDSENSSAEQTEIKATLSEEEIISMTREAENIPAPYGEIIYTSFTDTDTLEETEKFASAENITDEKSDKTNTHSVYEGIEKAFVRTTAGKYNIRPYAVSSAVARLESTKTEYPTLQEAIDAAHNLIISGSHEAQTVTLLADTKESVSKTWQRKAIDYDYNLTIDLNGHTVTGVGGPVMRFESGGTGGAKHSFNITINDSSKDKTGTITGGTGKTVTLSGNAGGGIYFSASTIYDTLTINGGNIENNTVDGNGSAIAVAGNAAAHLIINGGNIRGNTASNGAVSGRWITVNGGEITGNKAVKTKYDRSGNGGGIYLWGTGTGELEIGGNALVYGNTAQTMGNDIVVISQKGSVDYDVRLSDPAKWIEGNEFGAWYVDGADGLYDDIDTSNLERYQSSTSRKLTSYTVTEKDRNAPAYSIAATVRLADTDALQAAIDKFDKLDPADYSEESFSNLRDIVESNKDLLTSATTQQEVDKAVTEILEAMYDLVPYFNFTVFSENGSFEVQYDGSTYSENKYSLLFGTEVTLTATADEGYEFVGWYDVINNLYFSKENTYSFKITTNTHLKAVFVKEQSATLTFTTYSNWVQEAITKTIDEWNEITSIDDLLPEVPYRYGYSNGRWVYNNDEVLAKLRTGESVFLIPEYDEDDTSLPTPRESTDGTPALDLYYKLDEEADVASFVMAAGIPDDCEIESIGIAFYYKKAKEFDPTKFELLLNNQMLAGRFNTDKINDIYIINFNNFLLNYNWAARGYVTYYDADGNLKTAYSNQVNIVNGVQV
ncbi:MAG: S8 family serine peptidase [Eubacterium sp.]|nr:S8 family serine peptidase [Eubacterium sp.]